MEKSSQTLHSKKKDFSSQSLNVAIIDKQIKSLEDRDPGKPVALIIQVEFDDHLVQSSHFNMIAYLEYIGMDTKTRYERLNPEAIKDTGDKVPLATPIGLGNIRIPSDTLQEWIAKPGELTLTPVLSENPHLAYTDGTSTYFPSPPAPSTTTSSGA